MEQHGTALEDQSQRHSEIVRTHQKPSLRRSQRSKIAEKKMGEATAGGHEFTAEEREQLNFAFAFDPLPWKFWEGKG